MDDYHVIMYLILGVAVIGAFLMVYVYESTHRAHEAQKRFHKLKRK